MYSYRRVTLIRPITQHDTAAVIGLAVASGLFPEDETEILDKMMADYFAGNFDDGHRCVIDVEDEPLAVAYYEPALATDRTWYLTMIAVRRDAQGQGRGAALLRHVENSLQAEGQRVLLVETSGLPAFARTRAFYVKCGYEEEARIRDYYTAGDDMVVFRKVLNSL
jgi:ribosomal protein S18 acetylase RimI-like enzyme